MSKLPVASGMDAVRVFGKLGYEVDHQTAATSCSVTASLRTADSPCRSTGSSREARCER